MKWKKFSRLSEQPTTVVPETRHRGQLQGDKEKRGVWSRRDRKYQSEVKKRKRTLKVEEQKSAPPCSNVKSSDLWHPGSCDVIELAVKLKSPAHT